MSDKKLVGIIVGLTGAILGIIGGIIIFILTYEPYMLAERNSLGEEGCEVIIELFLPIILDLSVIGGILFALSAYGFYTGAKYSVTLAVVGNTLCLLAGFWPSIPAMQMGLVPIWLTIFLPNLLIFFILARYIEGIAWITSLFALIIGIAYVMSFLNGIASTNRMLLYTAMDTPTVHAVFMGLERLNWIAAIGFGIVTIGILRRPEKDWIRVLLIGSALLEIFAGYPIAIASSISFSKVSMFFMAPILATVIILIPLWPTLWERLVSKPEKIP
ncbi:MAG: hypothetical protein ACW981_17800 [Candidatus Hodarchaeales archaeon]|jgi:hypothetical protein